jgi:membrane-associated protein
MFDVVHLVESGGLLLIGAIVFAETGLLIGFFLPGDTLLLTAGIFAAQGYLNLYAAITIIVLASIAGNFAGYQIGHHTGKRIFTKSDGLLFRQEYITRAEKFYEKHGGKTILLARFVPIVRTFAAVVAGVAAMNMSMFMFYNILGGLLWGATVTLLGFWFGSRIPNIDHYILPFMLVIIGISFAPMFYHLFKDRLEESKAKRSPASKDSPNK